MASNSLLESYVHVVYENKKFSRKTFLENIFSTDQNFPIKKFDFFSDFYVFSLKKTKFFGKMEIQQISGKKTTFLRFENFDRSKNIFQEKVFRPKFLFS